MKTSEEIFTEMTEEFESVTGRAVAPECDMAVRMMAAAVQIEALYVYGDWVLRQCFAQTAQGEYLEKHGAMRSIVRGAAKKSSGSISFTLQSPATHNVTIPSGTVCMTAQGVSFETTEAGTITVGSMMATVPAKAVNAGAEGNVASGTIVHMTNAPVGVYACSNQSNFIGGENEESDDALRERLLRSYRTLSNGANAGWYEKTALEVEGVAAASVIPRAEGIGTVNVVIAQNDGLPTEELLDAVQQRFNDTREICVDINVCSPIKTLLNFDIDLTAKSGYDYDTVKSDVENAVTTLLSGRMLGKNIYISMFNDAIYHIEGVENFRINYPDSDYHTDLRTLLVPGNITIRRWMC